MLTSSLKQSLLIASIFTASLAGTGLASAQLADNPPGAAFQDQGIREWNGSSPFAGTHHAATPGAYSAFGSASRGAPLRQQRAVHQNAAPRDRADQRISAPIYFGLARGHG
jgi:hypothetical protein